MGSKVWHGLCEKRHSHKLTESLVSTFCIIDRSGNCIQVYPPKVLEPSLKHMVTYWKVNFEAASASLPSGEMGSDGSGAAQSPLRQAPITAVSRRLGNFRSFFTW